MEDNDELIDWIRNYSGCSDAEFLDPNSIEVMYDFDGKNPYEIKNIKRILFIGGLYLVEEYDSEDDWMMGDKHNDGKIYCWGNYGTLKNAIDGL